MNLTKLRCPKKAFALLMSLFLMAFLVVLILTLSAIVELSLKGARQNILNQQARNAAKLAAYQALGEVQKALGSDQRISANASILDTEINEGFEYLESQEAYDFWAYDYNFNREEVESIEGLIHPNWLGVWDSTPDMHPIARAYDESKEDYSERIFSYASAFLVSGNNTIRRLSILPEDESLLNYSPFEELSGDSINMLRKNSIADESGKYDTSTMSVKVPLLTLKKTDAMQKRTFLDTRIAWWVSDESQKAPANVIASEADFSLAAEQVPQSIAFKNGIEALSLKESDSAIFDLDLNNQSDRDYLRRLNDLSQLDLLKASGLNQDLRPSKLFYNSLAFDTRGLAVNVREGGLKKDLSVGLLALNPTNLEFSPNYFNRPIGVEGYDSYFKNSENEYNVISNSLYEDGKGHMFGAQAAGNMNLNFLSGIDYTLNDISSTITSSIHKDPGGPLWDSLREYYNNRVNTEGVDVYDSNTGYANKVRVKEDTGTGLSPVLLNYQLFIYPALTSYGDSSYGVRIYMLPIVVLWNPYDIDIAAGSTFAFRHGNGILNTFGNFRIAIGIKDTSDSCFKSLRDTRTEKIPRPLKNTENYSASLVSGGKGANEGDKDINFYRSVSFADEAGSKVISASDKGEGVAKINKSFFGYGNWVESDTESLVSRVEDNSQNPYFPSLVDFEDVSSADTIPAALTKGGLIRIYEQGEVSSLKGVTMPSYYKLSTDSFYYRKLYLNNVKYSLAWTGQVDLSSGGGASALTEANVLDLMEEHQDQSLRFLVRCQEVLKGGEARIFTLKSSVPYHYKWNGTDGYAGNFGKAVDKGWYLTEGVDTANVGAFFVDMIHVESAHTASTNDFGTSASPTYEHDIYKGQVFDPMNTDTHDGKAIGVLFDLSESERAVVYDDRDDSTVTSSESEKPSISIDDIYLDFGNFNDYSVTSADLRFTAGPLGYLRVDASFNRNPWYEATYTATPLLNEKNNSNSDSMPNHTQVYNELLMWNYADDNDSHKLLLYKIEDVTEVDKEDIVDKDAEIVIDIGADGSGNMATDGNMDFQGLKRYAIQRTEASFHHYGSGTLSFPDPFATESTGTYSYFNAPLGYAAFPNATAKGTLLNTISSDIFTSASTTKDGATAFGISRAHSLDRALISPLSMTNKRRSVIRAIAKPVFSGSGDTLYDVYYKNLMIEINSNIIESNVDAVSAIRSNGKILCLFFSGAFYYVSTYDVANSTHTNYNNLISALGSLAPSSLYSNDDSGYEAFLDDIGLNSTYRNASWAWEDPYFLLRDARRISNPIWTSVRWEGYNYSKYPASDIDQNDAQAWRDHVPFAFNAKVIVDSTDDRALSLEEFTITDGEGISSIALTEGINAYRPVSEDIDPTNQWQFQYPFKFPWLTQLNVSGKNYGDGRFGNAGTLRDRSYGTEPTRGQHTYSPHTFATWFARGDNLLAHTFFTTGTEGWQGNTLINNLLEYYINYEANSKHIQVGADVMSSEGYAYNLKHYLRDTEIVSSVADLATADLAFGADQSRNRGVGLGTADIIYPNSIIGASYPSMKIAPERAYDFDWIDSYSIEESTGYISLYGTYSAQRDDKEIRRIRYDISWFLNDLLWDEYFFSSLPYRSAEQNALDEYLGYLIPKNPRVEYINAHKKKIYSRISIEGESFSLNNKVEDTSLLEYDFEANAARFWVKGAFNVNSTNVDAWKMVLGSSFGNKIYGYDSSEYEASEKAPFPRNGLPYSAKEFDKDSVRGEEQLAMQGFRALDRLELEELALSVVENVKDRGPFFSLADFVNRAVELRSMETRRMGTAFGYNTYDFSNDIYSDSENEADIIKINADEADEGAFYLRQNHMQKGLLQSAIDSTKINEAFFDNAYLIDYTDPTASLNARFATMETAPDKAYAIVAKAKPSRYYTPAIQAAFWETFGNPRNVWENYKVTLGSTLAGAPAYLTQVDILKQIGSFITVRGDTFKIRAYGEIKNSLTNEIESKAWCEMLIQRFPEYIDSSKNPATDIDNRERELGYQGGRQEYDTLVEHFEKSAVNKHLGRRFKVLSFRWLSPMEI